MGDAEFLSHRPGNAGLPSIDGKRPTSAEAQEVDVDPTRSPAMQAAAANELDDVTVRNRLGLPHELVGGQVYRFAADVLWGGHLVVQCDPRATPWPRFSKRYRSRAGPGAARATNDAQRRG